MRVFADAGALIRDARRRHGLDQRELAQRAATSQTQVSRIERGEISPSVASLSRLLGAMGERLGLIADPAPLPGTPGWFPPHDVERRRDFQETTPEDRVAQAISLSRTATRIAAAAARTAK
jgi:transcriptional regulator with XRE-family HTH domain